MKREKLANRNDRMRAHRNVVWLAFGLACTMLSACASPPAGSARTESTTTAACCAALADIKYSALKPEQEQPVALGTASPMYTFEEGRSYFAAFDLPPDPRPAKLLFKTFVGGFILPYATVVRPYFLFVDGTGNPVGKAVDPPVFPGTDFWRGPFFKGEVEVPSEASRLIVYTSDRPVEPWTVYSENGTPWPAKPSMTGSLLIKVVKS